MVPGEWRGGEESEWEQAVESRSEAARTAMESQHGKEAEAMSMTREPALPSIAFLPCKEWWIAARAFVAARRRVKPRRLQKLRPERKRLRKLAPLIVADYLAGISCQELAERNNVGLRIAEAMIRYGTTPRQRRERTSMLAREGERRKKGIKFPAPEILPDPPAECVHLRVWKSVVVFSRRFIAAGFSLEDARAMAVKVVESDIAIKAEKVYIVNDRMRHIAVRLMQKSA